MHVPILEAKANGNVFGIALAQCVLDDDYRFQDETNTASSPTGPSATASEIYRKDSSDMVNNDKRTSPSGSVSSTNDSGYSVSPASPSSLHVRRNPFASVSTHHTSPSLQISDSEYEQSKLRSASFEALANNASGPILSRCNTLRCYPAKVPELIQNCCDYLEKNGKRNATW